MGMHVSYMAWHGKQILKGNQKKLATTPPTCSRYGKRHMISHPEEKAPRLTSPVSLGRIWTGPPLSSFCFHPRLPIFHFLTQNHFLLLFCVFRLLYKIFIGGIIAYYFAFCICLPCNSKSSWKICKIWDEIWSDLALWDVDIGGSYFITKLISSSSSPPIAETPTQQKPNS